MRQVVQISSDIGWHTAQLAAYAELGFDEIALHHVGQKQDEWIEIFGAKVLPQLRQASAGAPAFSRRRSRVPAFGTTSNDGDVPCG